LLPVIAWSLATSVSIGILVSPIKIAPSFWTEITVGSFGSLIAGAWVCGRSTGTPTVSNGAVTMKTTSNTSITSTSGVTLISDIGRRGLSPDRRPRAFPAYIDDAMYQGLSSSCRDRIALNSEANASSRPA